MPFSIREEWQLWTITVMHECAASATTTRRKANTEYSEARSDNAGAYAPPRSRLPARQLGSFHKLGHGWVWSREERNSSALLCCHILTGVCDRISPAVG